MSKLGGTRVSPGFEHSASEAGGWECKVGVLKNHRHHHCCCCYCYDHNQILEKGNLRLYICILKEEIEKAWV